MSRPLESIRIAMATPADVPEILAMIRQLAEYERLASAVTATESQLRATLFGKEPPAEVLLAFLQRECVGFALFFRTYSTFLASPGLWLEDLFVKPQARGQGVGSALLARVAAIAAARGCARLEWSVLRWNKPALAFYAARGAVPMEDWITCRLAGEPLERLAGKIG